MKKLTEKTRGRKRYISELPVYDSMETAQAATGIPKEAFQLAIKSGAQIKHHGRIDLGEFIRWWFQRPEADDEESNINWKRRGERATALLSEIDLTKAQKSVIEWTKVQVFLQYLTANIFFAEIQRLRSDAPANLVGKDEIDIDKEMKLEEAKIRGRVAKAIQDWKEKCSR
jgi:hypothetical protein